jgi:hypothetical protein
MNLFLCLNTLLVNNKKVLGFDEYGFAELVFRIRKGRLKGLHIISIEPFLLKIRQQRIKT